MDIATIGAGVAGASHAINVLKGLAISLKESGRAEAIGEVAEAQMLIMDLIEKQRLLADENRQLKEKLELIGKMTFAKPFYMQDEDKYPFCPQCWEASRKAIHLLGPNEGEVTFNRPWQWFCSNCCKEFWTTWPVYNKDFQAFDNK